MHRYGIAPCLVACTLLTANASAGVGVLNFTFTGEIDAPPAIFQDGATPLPTGFTLTVSADADERPPAAMGTFFTYTALTSALAFDAATVPDITLTNATVYVEGTSSGGDFLIIEGDTTYSPAAFPGTNGIGTFSLFLADNTSAVFGEPDLPTSLDLTDFDVQNTTLRFGDAGEPDPFGFPFPGTLNSVNVEPTADITPDPTPVIPTPSAFFAGLALLAGLATRRRRAS